MGSTHGRRSGSYAIDIQSTGSPLRTNTDVIPGDAFELPRAHRGLTGEGIDSNQAGVVDNALDHLTHTQPLIRADLAVANLAVAEQRLVRAASADPVRPWTTRVGSISGIR